MRKLLETTKDGVARSNNTLISQLYYFGHGDIGRLGPQYEFSKSSVLWMISIAELKDIFKKEYFTNYPYVELFTCHSASSSRIKNIEESLAQALSRLIEGKVKGINGRADYEPLGHFFPGAPKIGTSINEDADDLQVDWKNYNNGSLQK